MADPIKGPYQVRTSPTRRRQFVIWGNERLGNETHWQTMCVAETGMWMYSEPDEERIEATARLLGASWDMREALEKLRNDITDLIAESDGVAGLHRNGDLATWGDLTDGAHMHVWLGDALEGAAEALAKAKKEG